MDRIAVRIPNNLDFVKPNSEPLIIGLYELQATRAGAGLKTFGHFEAPILSSRASDQSPYILMKVAPFLKNRLALSKDFLFSK